MIDELNDRIWDHSEFHQERLSLLISNVATGVRVLQRREPPPEEVLVRLLQAAVHLAASRSLSYRRAAYEIGVAAWNCSGANPSTAPIVDVVLQRLGNFVASDFLGKRAEGLRYRVPLGIRLESAWHRETNSIGIGERDIAFTDFQYSLWNLLHTRHHVAVVAPTSAGKSFVLQHFIATATQDVTASAVYLVPTRALITQVARDLEAIALQRGLRSTLISTVPIAPKDVGEERLLYVITQERLQILLDVAPDIKFAVIAVDEAHLLHGDARGVLLQTMIEKTMNRAPAAQIVFASPLAKNPQVFRTAFDLPSLEISPESEPAVGQHLVFVDRASDRRFGISVVLDGERHPLGDIELEVPLYTPEETLANLAWRIGRSEQNLVYAGGPAESEGMARRLADLEKLSRSETGREGREPSVELKDFASFLREHVHKEFLLAETVESGIAYHFGNMPAAVRVGIEDLFANGELRFLVCTSTLLHGVNFPARNLFLQNPSKGPRVNKSIET